MVWLARFHDRKTDQNTVKPRYSAPAFDIIAPIEYMWITGVSTDRRTQALQAFLASLVDADKRSKEMENNVSLWHKMAQAVMG